MRQTIAHLNGFKVFIVAALVGALGIIAGLLVVGAFWLRSDTVDDRTYRLCLGVNEGRQEERLDARRTFARLDETLALLHLERTTEIVERAEGDRDRRIARNQPLPCDDFK